jgi:hypothetical protein
VKSATGATPKLAKPNKKCSHRKRRVPKGKVRVKDGPWYLLRDRLDKTWEDKIEGAVLSFQDIDSLKRTLDQTRTFAEALIEMCANRSWFWTKACASLWRIPCFTKRFKYRPM